MPVRMQPAGVGIIGSSKAYNALIRFGQKDGEQMGAVIFSIGESAVRDERRSMLKFHHLPDADAIIPVNISFSVDGDLFIVRQ